MSYLIRHDPPLKSSEGPYLESVEYDEEVGDYVIVREKEVPHKSARFALEPQPAFTDLYRLGSSVVNERNTNKVRLRERFYPKRVSGEGTVLVFPLQRTERADRSALLEFVDKLEETSQLVDRAAPFPSLGIMDIRAEKGRATEYADRVTKQSTELYRERVGSVTDPQTGWPIKVTRKVVFALPNPIPYVVFGHSRTYTEVASGIWIMEEREWEDLPLDDLYVKHWYESDDETGFYTRFYADVVQVLPASPDAEQVGIKVSYQPLANGKWLRVKAVQLGADGEPTPISSAVPFYSYTLETMTDVSHPSYIDPPVNYHTELMQAEQRTAVYIDIKLRTGFTKRTKTQIDVQYFTANPGRSAVTEWSPVDWIHNGLMFQLDIRNIVANSRTISVSPMVGDNYYPFGYTETYHAPSSKRAPFTSYLNATEYIGLINSYVLVDSSVERLANGNYRRINTRVLFE